MRPQGLLLVIATCVCRPLLGWLVILHKLQMAVRGLRAFCLLVDEDLLVSLQ